MALLRLPEPYDVISTFDVVHDAADPLGLLGGIRRSLEPGGCRAYATAFLGSVPFEVNRDDELFDVEILLQALHEL